MSGKKTLRGKDRLGKKGKKASAEKKLLLRWPEKKRKPFRHPQKKGHSGDRGGGRRALGSISRGEGTHTKKVSMASK